LRWLLQLGVSAIPKSSNPKRIEENFSVFDFSLSEEDMQEINSMNENYRIVDDPMDYF
jgi:methylglyoxal/glyoxal reductase